MPPSHPYSAMVVVPAAQRAAAEVVASVALGRDCTGEIGAPLSADGSVPETHYASNAPLTTEEYFALLNAFWPPLSPGALLGAEVFTTVTRGVDDLPGATTLVPDPEAPGGWALLPVALIDVGDPVPDVHPLQRRWTTDRVLVEVGLLPAFEL